MSQNENQTSSNIFLKNPTLNNMLKRISEEAKIKSSDNISLSLETNFNIFKDGKFSTDENDNYKNFTQEFFLERYKNFIPNNFMTPSNFLEKKELNIKESTKTEKNEDFIDVDFSEFLFYSENFRRMSLYRSKFTLQNWIKTYNELNQEKKLSIKNLNNSNYSGLLLLCKFFTQYSSLRPKTVIIAEIISIHIIDCLFIIEVIDFEFKIFQILISPKEEDSLTENTLTKREEQFKVGHIVLIRSEKMKEMKSSLSEKIYQVPTNFIKIS